MIWSFRAATRFAIGAEKQGHIGIEDAVADGPLHFGRIPGEAFGIGHGRHQIGHDHAAGKGVGAQRSNPVEHGALAKVDVHIQGRMQ